MNAAEFIVLKDLQLTAELQALGHGRATSTRGFIKFPCSWATRLTTAKYISTYRIALHLDTSKNPVVTGGRGLVRLG